MAAEIRQFDLEAPTYAFNESVASEPTVSVSTHVAILDGRQMHVVAREHFQEIGEIAAWNEFAGEQSSSVHYFRGMPDP